MIWGLFALWLARSNRDREDAIAGCFEADRLRHFDAIVRTDVHSRMALAPIASALEFTGSHKLTDILLLLLEGAAQREAAAAPLTGPRKQARCANGKRNGTA